VVPYFAREKIDLPEGIMSIIDADEDVLQKIEEMPDEDVALSRDYLMDGVNFEESEDSDSGEEEDEADDI
jgi:hypothetical protein